MKKLGLGLLSICALLSTGIITSTNTTEVNHDFNESVLDSLNGTGLKFNREIAVGDGEFDVSKIFYQTAEIENYYYIRFATALKGDINYIRYTRGAILDHESSTNDVNILYKGIVADQQTYYFDGSNETTDENCKGNYLWACYTISISKESITKYASESIDMSIEVNGNKKEASVSIKEALDLKTEVITTAEIEAKYGRPVKTNFVASETKTLDLTARGTLFEFEHATKIGSANVESKGQYSNGQALSSVRANTSFEFVVNSPSKLDALVVLRMCRQKNWSYNISDIVSVQYGDEYQNIVNSSDRKLVSGLSDATWTDFRDFAIGEIHLEQGENKIKVTHLSGDAPFNYDYMALALPHSQTLDVDVATKFGTTTKDELITYTTSVSKSKRGYLVETENNPTILYSSETGCKVADKTAFSGGSGLDRFRQGAVVSYEITAEEDMTMLLSASLASYTAGTVGIDELMVVSYGQSLDNCNETVYSGNRTTTRLTSWDNPREFVVGEISLKQGKNYVVFLANSPSNFDYFTLINTL